MPPPSALVGPSDPRSAVDLPAPGQMPRVARLEAAVTRVLAPNPSPMTLDGTNTYVLGAPGHGGVAIVDPGPNDAEHLQRVAAEVAHRDAACDLILVTHRHVDHVEAAHPWADVFECRVAAPTREVAGAGGRTVAPGERLAVAGLYLDVVATPGHTADHVCYRLPTGAVLTGDHVLGRGTSVVAHPDGDLAAYLDSLETVAALRPDALYPGHGPELRDDPEAVLRYYREHRRYRERQILACLAEAPEVAGTLRAGVERGRTATVEQLVARIYADVDRRVWPAAAASTRAALDKLARESRISRAGTGWRVTAGDVA